MSLKIIHTADWHLGQTFFGYDRDEEHEAFLLWLRETIAIQQADVLLIAGDVFDVANPSAAAQRRFFRFLKEINGRVPHLQIIIVAGNHDSAARLEAPVPLLEELNTFVIGVVRKKEDGEIDFDSLLIPLYNKEHRREAICLAVPFLRQGDYPAPEEGKDTYVNGINRMYRQLYEYAGKYKSEGEAIVAMGHLHATGAELSDDDRSERMIMGGLESVSADTFAEGLAYTALGHIHKAQRVGRRENVRYSGSPLPMSFSEMGYRHQVVAITLSEGKLMAVETLPVPRKVDLLVIPKQPVPPVEVIKALALLPPVKEGESISSYPFLEVCVLMTEPDPGFRIRVEEVLADKAVRLASILPSYPKQTQREEICPLSYADLQQIAPLDMLRHAFTSKYGGELPEELEELFNHVVREAFL